MEKGLTDDPFSYNGSSLAFIGDAVFCLMAREWAFKSGSHKAEKLHRHSTELVNAATQSRIVGILEPVFSDDELAIYHRGRNSKTITAAKHQTLSDYRRATGLEAVFGYLFLKSDTGRLKYLFEIAMNDLNSCGSG